MNVNTDNSPLWKRCKSSGHLLFLHTIYDIVDCKLQLGRYPDCEPTFKDFIDTAMFAGMVFEDLLVLRKYYGNQCIEV